MTATVLVADDEAPIALLLAEALASRGYAVVCAHDGAEALAYARGHPLALVLADVMMPGLDGLSLCQRLKADERTRHLPVVLMSALCPADEADSRADAFVHKPFDIEALLALVAHYTHAGGVG